MLCSYRKQNCEALQNSHNSIVFTRSVYKDPMLIIPNFMQKLLTIANETYSTAETIILQKLRHAA